MQHTIYHLGGFIPAALAQNRAEQWDSVAVTYTRWNQAGAQVEQRPFTSGETSLFAARQVEATASNNRDLILTKAQQALATNATFLAIATPTNAQNAAQVKALTRQVNALVRLLLGALNDVSDT